MSNARTFPIKWQIPTPQQSHGKFVGIEYNNEFEKENDDSLREDDLRKDNQHKIKFDSSCHIRRS